ncbi:MAG: hypothetical protein R3C44_15780 [Chloroflexota bacterium]
MNSSRQLQTADSTRQQQRDLQADLQEAQQQLRDAEAELATEQAAVNAFRMHARLMLDDLVDQILELLAAKQSALTRLQLLQQDLDIAALELGNPLDPEHDQPSEAQDEPDPVEALLPTNVPHDKAAERRLYRELARKFHPDLAESAMESAYRTSMMAAVNTAYAAGDLAALYDLAGELEPDEIARLATIKEEELRRLQELIVRCRRRQRKVRRQLQALRQESTARLWRKAQELEDGDNWWVTVRRDLDAARTRLQAEVNELEAQIALLEPVDLPDEAV